MKPTGRRRGRNDHMVRRRSDASRRRQCRGEHPGGGGELPHTLLARISHRGRQGWPSRLVLRRLPESRSQQRRICFVLTIG
jgi:hypothetical protein